MDESTQRRLFLSPGEVACAAEPTLITTVLGSCIAVTLWSAEHRVGGLNHFILPAGKQTRDSARYGDVAMAELLDGMKAQGARPPRLEAKVFGGAGVLSVGDQGSVGAANIRFAFEFLKREGSPVVGQRVGGHRGRLLVFNTHSGEALVRYLAETEALPSAS